MSGEPMNHLKFVKVRQGDKSTAQGKKIQSGITGYIVFVTQKDDLSYFWPTRTLYNTTG